MKRTLLFLFFTYLFFSHPLLAVEVSSRHITKNYHFMACNIGEVSGWYMTQRGIFHFDTQSEVSTKIAGDGTGVLKIVTNSNNIGYGMSRYKVYTLYEDSLAIIDDYYSAWDISVDSNNNLWILSTEAFSSQKESYSSYRLQKFESNTLKTVHYVDRISGPFPANIILDEENHIIRIIDRGLSITSLTMDGTFSTVIDTSYYKNDEDVYVSNSMTDIDSQGALWIAADILYTFSGNQWNKLDGLTGITALLISSQNIMWLGTGHGVYSISGTDTTLYTDVDGLPGNIVTTINEDSGGTIWISTTNGLAAWDGEKFRSVFNSTFPEEWENPVISLARSANDVTWCVANSNVFEITEDRVIYHDINDQIGFYSVFIDANETVWAGGDEGMAYRYTGESWEAYQLDPTRWIQEFYLDRNNTLWAHCKRLSSKLYSFNNEQWVESTPWDAEIPLNDIAIDYEGVTWFASYYDYGLMKLENGQLLNCGDKYEPLLKELGFSEVNQLAVDSMNRLWLVYHNNQGNRTLLGYIDNDQFITTDIPILVINKYSGMAFDQNDVLWLTIRGYGCYSYDGNQITGYSVENNVLLHDYVSTIIIDANNDKWLGTVGGITVLSDAVQPYVHEFKPTVSIPISNYPNPFNPVTIIEYSIPQDGHVILTIYNVSGQRISVLKDALQTAGNYSVTWNATGVPSGLYFCTLRTNGFTETRKMVLVK